MSGAASSQSVLSSGDWYKVAVLSEGVYKIDAAFVDKLGIDRQAIKASHLAVYGNGYNGMLPQLNSTSRPDDLLENAIYASGLGDDSFDDGDYILFYGKSSDQLNFDPTSGSFYSDKNIYTDSSFYFVTIKDEPAKSMETMVAGNVGDSKTSTYKSLQEYQIDEYNILKSGREWFGDRFSNSSTKASITFSTTGMVAGAALKAFVRVVSEATVASSYEVSVDGTRMGEITMSPVSGNEYTTLADIQLDTLSLEAFSPTGDVMTVEVDFNISSGNARGYLDFVDVQTTRHLDVEIGVITFVQEEMQSSFSIASMAANDHIWNISDPTNTRVQQFVLDGSNGEFFSEFSYQSFVAFEEESVIQPIIIGQVINQNLHDLAAADVIYITIGSFESEVQKGANFRLAKDGLLTQVVLVSEIFNEFSSGRQDLVAIRDFIRYQYIKHDRLKYVTLVGDGSYDYKDRAIFDRNLVPLYQARNSVHKIFSYSSEDFYGFMDEDEGEWVENEAGDHTMEIGVGRIPAKTVEEVAQYVNKMIHYESSSLSYRNWRNSIVFIADDGDDNSHQKHAEIFSGMIESSAKEFNVNKIYLDAYEQTGIKPNQDAPKATAAFVEAIAKGSLIVNYTGHGREDKLADENLFNDEIIADLSNRLLLPFFITATCQFGKYDDPGLVSGGEQMILHPNGGAVAMLTSTRPVYASSNFLLNEAFYTALLEKENGGIKRLGDLMRETKNNSLEGPKNRNYALLGDASMSLVFPSERIEITAINSLALEEQDTLKALGKYNLKGVVNYGEAVDESFNGSVFVTVFDKPSQFQTLGDEIGCSPEVYNQNDVYLFQGEASVIEGVFEIDLIIPKNIDYSIGLGKISLYAVNESKTQEANGYYDDLYVGGSASITDKDNTPPEIEIFMNNTGFVNGGKVGPDAMLLVKLSDQHGINISKASFGNDLIMYLDEEEALLMNQYYTASLDTYQEGWILYPMDNLTPGQHQLSIVAYDTYNNRSESTIDFVVTDGNGILLTNVMNYPNPMSDHTTFSFSHDRLGEQLDIVLSVVNLQGQEIIRNSYRFLDTPTTLNIKWDGKDANGNNLKKGIYLYKIVVKSSLDGAESAKQRKLLIAD
ncbi:MAG: type IX secretion system sortase PorU [Reichenbachiella sp.]